jgi:hypothetical protein
MTRRLWATLALEIPSLHQVMASDNIFVRLIPLGWWEVRLHFERRRAVESSFRGPTTIFHTHEPFGQSFLADAI